MNPYPQIKVDLLDLELILRAFENACKELDALAEHAPTLKIVKPYPYERAVCDRLSGAVAEQW